MKALEVKVDEIDLKNGFRLVHIGNGEGLVVDEKHQVPKYSPKIFYPEVTKYIPPHY